MKPQLPACIYLKMSGVKRILVFCLLVAIGGSGLVHCNGTSPRSVDNVANVVPDDNFADGTIIPGAERTELYLPLCKDKNVAIVANNSSLIRGEHLVDVLASNNVNIVKIFSPEHGFRGDAGAGQHVDNQIDTKTGIEVVSLYGKNRKPSDEDLLDVDVLIFDLQDVGVRFYTYISTLTYVMESCAENDIQLVVLDRPNPNAAYVDGPVLKSGYESFVGMHHVPIVYGMTIGEYGRMVNGEHWYRGNKKCDLVIIPIANYNHSSDYTLPVNPSPNLRSKKAITMYPTICLFEGTVLSVGRGTTIPFEIIGHPDLKDADTVFVPQDMPSAAVNPKHEGKKCKAFLLDDVYNEIRQTKTLNIDILTRAYNNLNIGEKFFTSYFDKLAGTNELRKQIMAGKTAGQIRQSWHDDIEAFKTIRAKYLIYD